MPISRIIGTDGNPNGNRDRTIDFHVLARALQGFQDSLGDAAGDGGKGKPRRYDGELVPPSFANIWFSRGGRAL
jgi:hypothetical protein